MKSRAVLLVLLWAAACPALPCRGAEVYADALAAYKTEHYADADTLCQKGLATLSPDANKERVRYLVLKGRIATGAKDYAKAKTVLEESLHLDPSSIAARRSLGDLAFRQRHYADARIAYQDAAHYQPGNADPDLVLALTYCALGQKDLGEALRQASQLNAFDDKTPAAYFAQAAIARYKGDTATAAQTLQTAATLYGPQAYADYARDYLFLFANS
ncbi:MAG: hypothetical protein PW734_07290 [Verrucomicrobium sp.]|nr:hypothetical protein [Verrucomicrobium sp.]